jgi:hypothetical protein
MLTPDQISELHRLHWVEKWPHRKIARHLHPRPPAISRLTAENSQCIRERTRKIDPWKAAIADLLLQDPAANAPVIALDPSPKIRMLPEWRNNPADKTIPSWCS